MCNGDKDKVEGVSEDGGRGDSDGDGEIEEERVRDEG